MAEAVNIGSRMPAAVAVSASNHRSRELGVLENPGGILMGGMRMSVTQKFSLNFPEKDEHT